MAVGRRCGMGCTGSESWPDNQLYKNCPTCGEPTTRYRGVKLMDPDEARSLLLHSEFEAFYEQDSAKRGIPVDGPLVAQTERELSL